MNLLIYGLGTSMLRDVLDLIRRGPEVLLDDLESDLGEHVDVWVGQVGLEDLGESRMVGDPGRNGWMSVLVVEPQFPDVGQDGDVVGEAAP